MPAGTGRLAAGTGKNCNFYPVRRILYGSSAVNGPVCGLPMLFKTGDHHGKNNQPDRLQYR